MKKISILLLIFIVACGKSEDEIQAGIDEAIIEAKPTTTTTIELVGLFKEDVAKVIDLNENKI